MSLRADRPDQIGLGSSSGVVQVAQEAAPSYSRNVGTIRCRRGPSPRGRIHRSNRSNANVVNRARSREAHAFLDQFQFVPSAVFPNPRSGVYNNGSYAGQWGNQERPLFSAASPFQGVISGADVFLSVMGYQPSPQPATIDPRVLLSRDALDVDSEDALEAAPTINGGNHSTWGQSSPGVDHKPLALPDPSAPPHLIADFKARYPLLSPGSLMTYHATEANDSLDAQMRSWTLRGPPENFVSRSRIARPGEITRGIDRLTGSAKVGFDPQGLRCTLCMDILGLNPHAPSDCPRWRHLIDLQVDAGQREADAIWTELNYFIREKGGSIIARELDQLTADEKFSWFTYYQLHTLYNRAGRAPAFFKDKRVPSPFIGHLLAARQNLLGDAEGSLGTETVVPRSDDPADDTDIDEDDGEHDSSGLLQTYNWHSDPEGNG